MLWITLHVAIHCISENKIKEKLERSTTRSNQEQKLYLALYKVREIVYAKNAIETYQIGQYSLHGKSMPFIPFSDVHTNKLLQFYMQMIQIR